MLAPPDQRRTSRLRDGVTEDSLFGGRLTLLQPARGAGYRTNVDALLRGAFAAEGGRRVKTAVDLGAGVGAVGLSLLFLGVADRVEFLEKDPLAAELCRRNLKANHMEHRGTVHTVDLANALGTALPDLVGASTLVVANPPYVAPERDGSVRPRGRNASSLARSGPLLPFVRSAASALAKRGRVCFVYPAHALLELTTVARQSGLEPKRVQFVHGKAERPARVALIELASAKAGGLVVVPPLVEVDDRGRATAALRAILDAEPHRPTGIAR